MADSGSPGTNMPWDTVDLVDASGEPIENTARDAILAVVEQALANPDVDPDVLLEIASRVSAQIGSVQNLAAYTGRAIFRASKKASIEERKWLKRFRQFMPQEAEALRSSDPRCDPIEKQILVRELLETLNGLDREIYLRRLNGFEFAEIDKALSLRPRTSEYRFREAKLRLQALSRKDAL